MREREREKMMNLLAMSLVVSSLTFAGIWSPSPEADRNHNNGGGGEQFIVAGGHRVVLVEYADATGQGNTRVSISPPSAAQDEISSAAAAVVGVAEEPKDKVKAAAGAENGHVPGPGELICDACGKCKHEISGVLSRAKEKLSETAHEVEDEVKEVIDKAKEVVSKATHKVQDGGKKVGEKTKHAYDVSVEKLERAGEDIAKNFSSTGEEVARQAKEAEETVEDAAKNVKEKGENGRKELADIARRVKEVLWDPVVFAVSPELAESLMGTVQLMGFSIAYGVAVWVTFVMSHVMAGVLPRQKLGMVQSKMYPVYFKVMAFSMGVSLLGHLFGQRRMVFSHKAEMMQGYNLLGSLLLVLANLLFLEPRATQVMLERMKLGKEGRGRERSFTETTRFVDTLFADAAGPETTNAETMAATAPMRPPPQPPPREQDKIETLNSKLKTLNSYSSWLNIMTLTGLSWHLVYLSQRLHTNPHRGSPSVGSTTM